MKKRHCLTCWMKPNPEQTAYIAKFLVDRLSTFHFNVIRDHSDEWETDKTLAWRLNYLGTSSVTDG